MPWFKRNKKLPYGMSQAEYDLNRLGKPGERDGFSPVLFVLNIIPGAVAICVGLLWLVLLLLPAAAIGLLIWVGLHFAFKYW
jgi:hypothetical protein